MGIIGPSSRAPTHQIGNMRILNIAQCAYIGHPWSPIIYIGRFGKYQILIYGIYDPCYCDIYYNRGIIKERSDIFYGFGVDVDEVYNRTICNAEYLQYYKYIWQSRWLVIHCTINIKNCRVTSIKFRSINWDHSRWFVERDSLLTGYIVGC